MSAGRTRVKIRSMSLPIAVRTTGNPRRWGASRSRPRAGGTGRARWWAALASVARWIGRALVRLWRSLGTRTRLWIKVLAGVALLTAPIWTLNLAVAFLGRTAVFP